MTIDEARAEFHKSADKAIDALARWKFWMFGYYAADCVKLNRRHKLNERSPFKVFVDLARSLRSVRATTTAAA